jgi:transposase
MLGTRDAQRGLFEADAQYLGSLPEKSFYVLLARLRGNLFRDEDFAQLYAEHNGRPSVPPSLLATALVLQTFEGVSDQQAKERADYDLRWKVALGVGIEDHPFAKSTLQLFRAQLVAHDEARAIFRKSLELAKKHGLLKKNRRLRVALDTTHILGRGAVKDTYNLLGDGIVRLLRQLAKQAGAELEAYAEAHHCGRYVAERSLKGGAALNWDDARERTRFLGEIVADADRLLAEAGTVQAKLRADSPEALALREAAGPLSQVLLQDIGRGAEGAELREGVAKDRLVAVHDPEMRHGRKSARKRFDGHKVQIAVDTESQLVTEVDALAGNAPDATGALAMVAQTEANTGEAVAETVADCAYGSGATRQEFAVAGRTLIAKVAATRNGDRFPKTDFAIDLTAPRCTCPAGQTGIPRYARVRNASDERTLRGFRFAASTCQACPLRPRCVRATGGRSIAIHPQEVLLQRARAFQQSPAFAEYRQARQAAEHRIARLAQLGIRQARYFGRTKTLFQVLLAATVANLTLLAGKTAWEQLGGTPDGLVTSLLVLATFVIVLWEPAAANGRRIRDTHSRATPRVRRSLALGPTC